MRAIALVLHGGAARSTRPVPPWSTAYLRMRPFAWALRRAGATDGADGADGADGLAVASLRYLVRGWNGPAQSPVPDARWALDQLRERFGDQPVALIGHSMGGRTALAAADHESVRTVVALAPWIESGDPVDPVTGRTLLIMHGTADHITSPTASAQFAAAARAVAKQVSYVSISGESHPLLHRPRFEHELTAAFTVQTLLGRPAREPLRADVAKVLAEAIVGTPVIEA